MPTRCTWSNQKNLRKEELTLYGNYAKCFMGLYKVPTTGQRTLIKRLKSMATIGHPLIPQICSKVIDDKLTIMSAWTNDILGTLSTLEGELLAKAQLSSSYEIKDLGEAKLILGMWITRNTSGDITLSQQAYCK